MPKKRYTWRRKKRMLNKKGMMNGREKEAKRVDEVR
jgi:hypothetical protein